MGKLKSPTASYGNIEMNVSIPISDVSLFKSLARRFGWSLFNDHDIVSVPSQATKDDDISLDDIKEAANEAILISKKVVKGKPFEELIKSL